MTFREYWVSLFGDDEQALLNYNGGKLLWDASRTQALFDAGTRAGDTANESEKVERRKVALSKLVSLIGDSGWLLEHYAVDADVIIKEAQG